MKAAAAIGAAVVLTGVACGTPPAAAPSGGDLVYRRHCQACHALEAGANTPAGPTLERVVGRAIAAEPDFNYSPALRELAAREPRWTPELLDRFLADPQALAPGNEMGLPGLDDAAERRALVHWLGRRGHAG